MHFSSSLGRLGNQDSLMSHDRNGLRQVAKALHFQHLVDVRDDKARMSYRAETLDLEDDDHSRRVLGTKH